MKPLTIQQLVAICDASPDQVARAAQLMGATFPGEDMGWIDDGLQAGHYHASTVTVDGAEKYLLVYHVTDQAGLNVNAAAQLAPGGNFAALVAGMKLLARSLACKSVEGITMRAGVLKKLLEHGFQPGGVMVRLTL
jgi:hypothetical protein